MSEEIDDVNDEVIKDFDILKPPSNYRIIGGEKVDLSFVPTGITFKVDKLIRVIRKENNKLNELKEKIEDLINENKSIEEIDNEIDEVNEKMFNYSIDLCVLFCSSDHPKLSKDWFLKKTDPIQIRAIVDEINNALSKSYEAVGKYGKN